MGDLRFIPIDKLLKIIAMRQEPSGFHVTDAKDKLPQSQQDAERVLD